MSEPTQSQNPHELRNSYQNAKLLREFWEKANRARTRGGRLDLLRRYVAIELAPDPFASHIPNTTRKHFQKEKSKGRFRLKDWCWVCDRPAAHRHHIIPLRVGGRNRRDNLVPLCVSCHREAHRHD